MFKFFDKLKMFKFINKLKKFKFNYKLKCFSSLSNLNQFEYTHFKIDDKLIVGQQT